ncbi:MAG: DNA repair protein RadA, partial [Clostridiales bacterium]|nr:DNA repair protein RadA [Clostridiales bacterium]
MAKVKTVFICSSCGFESTRWLGKCPDCDSWNTLEEAISSGGTAGAKPKEQKQRGGTGAQALHINDIEVDDQMHQ